MVMIKELSIINLDLLNETLEILKIEKLNIIVISDKC